MAAGGGEGGRQARRRGSECRRVRGPVPIVRLMFAAEFARSAHLAGRHVLLLSVDVTARAAALRSDWSVAAREKKADNCGERRASDRQRGRMRWWAFVAFVPGNCLLVAV